MKTVDRYTRAGDAGKVLACPQCGTECVVYHFSWSALQCEECDDVIEKTKWILS